MDDRKNAKDLQHERQIAVSGHLVKGNISPSASKARCEVQGARCQKSTAHRASSIWGRYSATESRDTIDQR